MKRMYRYVITKDCKIKTPHVDNISQIKWSSQQFKDHIVTVSEYPTGLILRVTQFSDHAEIESNREFTDNGDGTISVSES